MKNHKYILIILATIYFVSFFGSGNATEEYSETTGTECNVCHIDPLGGGELSETGKGYLLSVAPKTVHDEKNGPVSRIVKLIFLYIHITTAFLWFGTILYVHLVLKPAYASKGLPSGEVKVGIVSMIIMAISGVVLTYYKVPSITLLFTSNFGILLLIKIIIFTIMVSSAVFVILVIGPRLKKRQHLQPASSKNLTIDELASFDGEEGRPAYFAYKGKIYDVSRSRLWKNGNHMTRHQAGADLTEILSQAPHDEDKVLSLPEVGQLATQEKKPRIESHKKVFYFMAYMNLGFVFIITLILALWRW